MSNQQTSKPDIDREVQSLLKKSSTGKIKDTYSIIDELKAKYGKDTDIVDSIMHKYQQKLERVRKLARKIKERLVQKHPNLSTKDYIKKIEGYKEKYGFDDSEASSIINLIFYDKKSVDHEVEDSTVYNEMSKALGFVPASYNLNNKLHYSKDQVEAIQGILLLNSASKELHNQVILSHLVHYGMCSEEVDRFEAYEPDVQKVNIFSFVHPVIAALFLPKINIIEQHMLLASISNIVKCKYEGSEIATQPEYELYYDIATDPAEVQCTTKVKPFTDLLARANVQTKLWESVLQLRQIKPHTGDLQGFLTAIDNCRGSIFDAADMAFIKDEGTIMRKLLGAFSLRPIIVRTMPVYNSASMGVAGIPLNNTFGPGVSMATNIVNINTAQITTLSMVSLRIPFVAASSGTNTDNKFSIQTALEQTQLYIQNKQISVKKQEILLAREFITFYINRRSKTFDFMKYLTPFAMSNMPIASTGLEEAIQAVICFGAQQNTENKFDDTYDDHEDNLTLTLGGQGKTFALTSVVTVKTINSNIQSSGLTGFAGLNGSSSSKNLIVGSKAYVRIFSDLNTNNPIPCNQMINLIKEGKDPQPYSDDHFLCYDPLKLGKSCNDKGYDTSNTYSKLTEMKSDKQVIENTFVKCDNQDARIDIKRCGTLLIFTRCANMPGYVQGLNTAVSTKDLNPALVIAVNKIGNIINELFNFGMKSRGRKFYMVNGADQNNFSDFYNNYKSITLNMIDLKKNVKKYGKTKSENIMTNIINSYEVLQKNAKSVVLNEDLRKLVESPVQTGGNDPLVKIGGNESEQLFVGLHLDAIKEFSEKLVNDINNNPENEESVSTSADVDPINDDELENSEK